MKALSLTLLPPTVSTTGTRLGSTDPKGMFPLGFPSGSTLFQIQAERIQRLQSMAADRTGVAAIVPWYIMTSGATRPGTESFLAKNDYFGLDPENVSVPSFVSPCIRLNSVLFRVIMQRIFHLRCP